MTSQRDIVAEGDVAGGDINKPQTNNYYSSPKTQLIGLIEQLRQEIRLNPNAAEFVDSLLSWITPKSSTIERDLATKLRDCGKTHLVSDALESKERFTKQLKRTAFNPGLQEIYARILGEIQTRFNLRIKPIIETANERGKIEAEIEKLAETITNQLSDAPPELGIGIAEVIGMLYFLTGNCYIDWVYYDSVPSCD